MYRIYGFMKARAKKNIRVNDLKACSLSVAILGKAE